MKPDHGQRYARVCAITRRAGVVAVLAALFLAEGSFMDAQGIHGGAPSPPPPTTGAAARVGPTRIAAHRGGALLWPENSLFAFRNALGLGLDLLETDVHLTADGEIVVLHDATLDRTTTATGSVSAVPLAQLAAVRLKARDGGVTGEAVPTLAQVLDLVRPSPAELLLEIKVGADRQRYPGIEEKVLALLRRRDMLGRTVIMAFEPETVRRVRELVREARTLLLIGRGRVQRDRVSPAEAIERAKEVGAGALGISHRLIDADVAAAIRRARILLAAWTVNDEGDIRRVLALGVDIVISDRPDLAKRLTGQ